MEFLGLTASSDGRMILVRRDAVRVVEQVIDENNVPTGSSTLMMADGSQYVVRETVTVILKKLESK